jgi:hypothetical protein
MSMVYPDPLIKTRSLDKSSGQAARGFGFTEKKSFKRPAKDEKSICNA